MYWCGIINDCVVLFFQATMLVELLCLLVFTVRLGHYAKVIPRDKFWKDPKNICMIVILLVGADHFHKLNPVNTNEMTFKHCLLCSVRQVINRFNLVQQVCAPLPLFSVAIVKLSSYSLSVWFPV